VHYAVIGLLVFWLMVPRLVLSLSVVWAERLRRTLFRRSMKVGARLGVLPYRAAKKQDDILFI